MQQELHEESEVTDSDTVIHPGAVVVHPEAAGLARVAVVGALYFVILTFVAPGLCSQRLVVRMEVLDRCSVHS